MDSRLQRRIKWWKEQLKKKKKRKQESFFNKEKLEEKLVDESEVVEVTPTKRHERKRKRKEDIPETVPEDASSGSQPRKKKKRKDSILNDRETVKAVTESTSDATVKKKYILFIGNIPFSATVEDVTNHFQRAGIKVVDFRLLTKKSGSSKGCGFMELKSSKQLQAGLKLHHTKFDDRRINVELSCGGGGKNDKRKEKIKAKNKRLQKQRTKKRKKIDKTESTDEMVTSE